ncbi:MAG: globin domain-containing protein [Reichenbachiella sp.]|uniref:globin domain-containing protein n=1 Tax=Reichenbachiella sp. TaxID=2184521 RepID=UPI0029662507|nr:globin domain-containing protein [Reichenbachiella sp.]MDW3210784.1 globin domain-containing protein [Reichenbachiella sp.]
MNERELMLVKSCWQTVAPNAIPLAMKFYDDLFEAKPEYRKLFSGDMNKQAEKLMMTLGFLMANVDRVDKIKDAIHKLGALHVKFKVLPEYYPPVQKALVGAIAQFMDDEWSYEHEAAWNKLISAVGDMMIEGSAKKKFSWKFWK